MDGAVLALHLVPLMPLDRPISPETVLQVSPDLVPVRGSDSGRFNSEGYVVTAYGQRGYVQLFREGAIEVVDCHMLGQERNGTSFIPTTRLEREVIKAARSALAVMARIGVAPPVVMMLTLLNVRGFELAPGLEPWSERTPIDVDNLLLPDLLVENLMADSGELLRPAFDTMWQAGGFERSENYGPDGKWRVKQ